LLGTVVGVDVLAAGAGVELVVAVELWVLDVDDVELLLPQPAISPPPASATTNHVDSCRIMSSPRLK